MTENELTPREKLNAKYQSLCLELGNLNFKLKAIEIRKEELLKEYMQIAEEEKSLE